jgi:hypothetical protein
MRNSAQREFRIGFGSGPCAVSGSGSCPDPFLRETLHDGAVLNQESTEHNLDFDQVLCDRNIHAGFIINP